MNRFKAASIHLGISLVIALITFLWLRLVWYPGALFMLMGGLALLIILLGVDVVIGPLITLIIFNPAKKHLKWDLACIALLQVGALSYGLYTMCMARPIWMAYAHKEFQVVSLPDVVGSPNAAKFKGLRTLPVLGPKFIGIAPDQELKGQFEVEMGMASGAKISFFPQGWKPYEQVRAEVLSAAKPLDALAKEEGGKALLESLKASYSSQEKLPLWVPLVGRTGRGIVVLDPVSGIPIKTMVLG